MNEKKIAYIGGKVAGLNFDKVVDKFGRMANDLRQRGLEVVNPVEQVLKLNWGRALDGNPPLTDDNNRKEILGICLYKLSQCDELHLLPDWGESEGATLERLFAIKVGMRVIYHPFNT